MSFAIIINMSRSKNFEYNEKLKDIMKHTGFKTQEIADIIGCDRTSVLYWQQNKYRMKQEAFNMLMKELADYLDARIEKLKDEALSLDNYRKQVVSVVHNDLHKI